MVYPIPGSATATTVISPPPAVISTVKPVPVPPVVATPVAVVYPVPTIAPSVIAVTAGASGNFSLTFLPVGGPYEITVSSPGYQTAKLGGIYLALNETESVEVTLARSAAEEVVVTAAAGSVVV